MALSNKCLWGTFGKQRKATYTLSCLSVCPHKTTRFSPGEFLRVVDTFIKICQEIASFVKIGQKCQALYMEPLSMFIIIFQCITTGKTDVSEECFV
jgi:hypothetical protein